MNFSLPSYFTKAPDEVFSVDISRATSRSRLKVILAEQKQAKQALLDQGVDLKSITVLRVRTDLTRTETSSYFGVPLAFVTKVTARDGKYPVVSISRAHSVSRSSVYSPITKSRQTESGGTPSSTQKQKTEKSASKSTEESKSVLRGTPKKVKKETIITPPSDKKSVKKGSPLKRMGHLFTEKLHISDSGDDDYYDSAPAGLIVQTVDKKPIKFDGKAAVPKWVTVGDFVTDSTALEQFIVDLKRAKKLGSFESDAALIFCSLNASGKSFVLEEIPAEAQDSLEKFIDAIRLNAGLTPLMLREAVNNLRQKESETYHSFFYRCINLYYRAKDEEPKTVAQIQTDKAEMSDLVHIYLKGLKNRDVQFDLRANLSTIEFQNLPLRAKNYDQARASRSLPIHTVSNEERVVDRAVEKLIAALNIDTSNRRVRFQNNDHNRSSGSNFQRGRSPGRQGRGFQRNNNSGRGRYDSRGSGRGSGRYYQSNQFRNYGQQGQSNGQHNRFNGQYNQPQQKRFHDDRARNITCHRCHRVGHYARDCLSK